MDDFECAWLTEAVFSHFIV